MRFLVLLVTIPACGKVLTDKPADAPPAEIDAPVEEIDAPVDTRMPSGLFELTGTVNPATVFDTIEHTFKFGNNLVNSVWHRQTNFLLTGEFTTAKYWAFNANDVTFPAAPDQGTTIHGRMVQVPATNHVIFSTNAAPNTTPPPASTFVIANVASTGLLVNDMTVVFGDGFAGTCNVTSSTATEFLCFDGTLIRRYTTAANSNVLTANGTITLSQALPTSATCSGICFGATFAFDGAFIYFATEGSTSANRGYTVYTATGTFVNAFTAPGVGAIDGVYFDWSVARYSSHDGFGGRTGGTVHGNPADSDTHVFSPISANHTLDE
jgi:hypothetical protein